MNQNDLTSKYLNYLGTPRVGENSTLYTPAKPKTQATFYKLASVQTDPSSQVEGAYLSGNLRYISDFHFGHRNILTHCNRPFVDLEEMHAAMLDRYTNVVSDDDVVIFGGDIGFFNLEQHMERIAQLKGHKILVIGNHDIDKKKKKLVVPLAEQVFDHICVAFSFKAPTHHQPDREIWCTHYPMLIDLPVNVINLHGHTHERQFGAHYLNMSVECIDYTPTLLV